MRIASCIRSAALASLTLGLAFVATPAQAQEAKDTPLFNGKDLTGWTIFIRHPEKGADPTRDPNGIFKVKDGVIHISGQHFGGITTEKEYEDYHLKLEFKWGDKKWPPREKAVRDSGILYHCVGPEKVWTKSVECQIQEHDCGDFYMVDGTSAVIAGKREPRYSKKLKDAEKPNGEWNSVEVICKGDTVKHIVNGVLVAEATGLSLDKDGKVPLTKGKILLQSEGAEVFYRNITIKSLK
ncbi:DUF1080 domain-containing protein [bacterium]|nr:DUF1080 domain-containing protein [bacterium]